MNHSKSYEQLKRTIRFLSDIPDELIDNLYDICRHVHIKKGQRFIEAGEVPASMGFNLNGIFRLYYIDDEGNDLTKGFCTPGKFVVSYSALAQNRPSYIGITPGALSRIRKNLEINLCEGNKSS